jgi:hypothetical protein
MKTTIVLMAILVSNFAFAGATQVFVDCQSANKKIKLFASFPGDMLGSVVDLAVGQSKKTYLDEFGVEDIKMNRQDINKVYPQGYEIASIAGVDRTEMKVLTIAVVKDGVNKLELVAIPPTVKMKTVTDGETGLFSAKLQTIDPSGKEENISATLQCTYDYTI